MAKNVNHVSHIKSKQIVNGKPKLPESSILVEGEIAINFAEGVETISTKNESGDVVTFSSDDYYTEQKLGSGFTGENSGRTVTEALKSLEITVDQVIDETTSASTNPVATKAVVDKLIEDEETWAISLNELNNNKFGYAEFDDTTNKINFYKDSDAAETGTSISTVDLSTFSIDIDQVIDDTTSGSPNAVSTSAVYGFVTSYTPSITVDQVLDNSTSASTNPVSSKAVYKAVTDNELVWTNAFVSLSGSVSSHTENTEIHVTDSDKTKWNKVDNKQDVSGMTAYTTTADTSALSGTVTAHTADTDIHVTTNDKSTWNAKLDASDVEGFFGAVNYDSNTKRINFYNESTGGTVLSYVDATDFIKDGMVSNVEIKEVSGKGTCLVITFNSDAGKEAIEIPLTDIFNPNNYYTKQELTATTDYATVTKANSANTASTVALTGVTDADDLKAIEALNGTSGILRKTAANTWALDTTVYSSATEVNTALSTKANTATTLGGYGITDAYTKSETSGATEISNALEGKVNVSDVVSAITPDNSGSTNPVAVRVVTENERIISESLVDLDSRKLDASAYTPTDLSNYYTKDETSGKTELSTAFNAKADTATTLGGYGITDAYTKSETSGATEISNALGAKVNSATFTAHTADTSVHFTTGTVQTQIDNSISGKVNTSDIVSAITSDNSGSTNPIATSVVAKNEKVVSEALVDLDSRKLDASAYTPTDLSNYYAKDETSGSTELADAFNSVSTSIEEQSETVAAALNLLNERITQLEEQITALNGN